MGRMDGGGGGTEVGGGKGWSPKGGFGKVKVQTHATPPPNRRPVRPVLAGLFRRYGNFSEIFDFLLKILEEFVIFIGGNYENALF
jgi:hypothetical protein